MRSRLLGPLLACSVLAGVGTTTAPAHAELTLPPAKTVVPVVLWGITGAVIGAIAVPVVMPSLVGGGAAAGPVTAMTWTWGSFVTNRALIGAAIGGALGYAIAPP
ncbi:MAG: hypothetical protein AB7F35_15630 [Acetobacteraceae bacterium]